jgi:hypothetical protein
MKVERLEKLITKLRDKVAEANKASAASVIVGYSAAYALFVHENMELHPPGMILAGQPRPKNRGNYWDPQGQAQPKFLEQPARELSNSGELSRIVADALQRGATMAQALVTAGLRIQRESMLLVPVDTGNLKASAFTKLEGS